MLVFHSGRVSTVILHCCPTFKDDRSRRNYSWASRPRLTLSVEDSSDLCKDFCLVLSSLARRRQS